MNPPPIGTILDYRYNAAHGDHIHVEPPVKKTGTPPLTNPGMSPGVRLIYDALEARFGKGAYFLDKNGRYVGNDPGIAWTHMGGWNRRPIAGTTRWSQHSYWNALDIGPYIDEEQKPFYDFLTGKESPMPLTPEEEQTVKEIHAAIKAEGSNGSAFGRAVLLIRVMRKVKEALSEEDF